MSQITYRDSGTGRTLVATQYCFSSVEPIKVPPQVVTVDYLGLSQYGYILRMLL